jgi:shikimate kinase
MGSGKSTVGKSLATDLNCDFIDSDTWIEKQQGMNVSSIFNYKGEEYFRRLEHQFIVNLNPAKLTVIATGGGLPCFNTNFEEMKNKGVVFYLKASLCEILNRTKNDLSRPLLSKLSDEEKILFIENKLNERSVFYEQANYTIDANQPIDQQLIEIKCRLI